MCRSISASSQQLRRAIFIGLGNLPFLTSRQMVVADWGIPFRSFRSLKSSKGISFSVVLFHERRWHGFESPCCRENGERFYSTDRPSQFRRSSRARFRVDGSCEGTLQVPSACIL